MLKQQNGDRQLKSLFSETQYVIDLSKFVPCLVIKKLIEQKKAAANPENPQVV